MILNIILRALLSDIRRPAACPRDPVRTCVIPSVARDLSVSRRSLGVKSTPRDDTGSRGQAAGRRIARGCYITQKTLD